MEYIIYVSSLSAKLGSHTFLLEYVMRMYFYAYIIIFCYIHSEAGFPMSPTLIGKKEKCH